ncbi:MAG: glycosyltransferase family 2 protein [Planctomycetota bacterium]
MAHRGAPPRVEATTDRRTAWSTDRNRTIDPEHSIAILSVTWNKAEDAARVLAEAAASEGLPLDRTHAVLVDNASDPRVRELVFDRLRPERVVVNEASRDGPAAFVESETGHRNALGFASITLIENRLNLGGCGGFNTAMRYAVGPLEDRAGRLDRLWLLDDDVLLPSNTFAALAKAIEGDERAALVGARAVDAGDRATTFETTIYFDHDTGLLAPDPSLSDARRAEHEVWAASVGGTRGGAGYAGVREVDVASACCLLARRELLDEIGQWDTRYFLYGDDADWSLRAGAAGHRVLCALDAVIYHTPWFSKLTPGRAYLAERNLLWSLGKRSEWRRLLARRSLGLAKRAWRELAAAEHARAWFTARAVIDAARNRGGGPVDPPAKLRLVGALGVTVRATVSAIQLALTGAPREHR